MMRCPGVKLLVVFFTFAALWAGENSFLWLDRLPQSDADVASWVVRLKGEGEFDDARRLLKLLLWSDDSTVREWAAFWLGNLDSSLTWVHQARGTQWGSFFYAVRASESAPDSAVEIFEKLATSADSLLSLLGYYWEGIVLCESGEKDSAFALWTRALKKYPGNILSGEMEYRLGKLRFDAGDYPAAQNFLAEAINFYDTCTQKSLLWWGDEAFYLLAVAFLRQGNIDSARAVLERMKTEFAQSLYVHRVEVLLTAYGNGVDSAGAGTLPPDIRADLLVRQGWDLMDRRDFKTALENFVKALKIDSTTGVPALYAGECAYYLKDYPAADSFYSMVRDSALLGYALWGRGWSLVRQGKFDDGRAVWRQITDSAFADPVAFAVAKSFFLQNLSDSAVVYFERYLSDSSFGRFRDEATYLLALAYLEARDTSNAVKTARTYLKYFPLGRRGEYLAYTIGKALFARESFSSVVAWADSFASKFDGIYGDSLVLLRERAKYHLGEYKEVLDILNGFLAERPKSPLGPQLARQIGEQFEQAHRWRDAIYAYTKAENFSLPGDSIWNEAAMGILRSALAMGDTARAKQELRSILIDGEDPYPALAEITFARYLVKNGNAQRAVEVYNDVLSMRDTMGVADSAILDLTKIYISAQMFPEAEKIVYPRWRQTEKSSKLAQRYAVLLAKIYWEMGEADSAVSFALNFADSAAQPCSVLVYVGRLTFQDSRSELAARVFDKIKKLNCQDIPPDFLLRMAELMAQQDRPSDACSLFNLVLAHHPNDSLGEIAREGIKSLPISCDTGSGGE